MVWMMMAAVSGCAHITTVQPGPKAGEFYVLAERYNPLGFPSVPQGYVLRCETRTEAKEAVTTCTRVFQFEDAAALAPDAGTGAQRTRRRPLGPDGTPEWVQDHAAKE